MKTLNIQPNQVHEILSKHMLVDGFPVVVDLEKSHGSWLYDSRTNKEYLDFFSFFASNPLGFNHPIMHDAEVEKRLLEASRVKVSNSDKYTTYMAEFVDTLSKTAGPSELPYYFFIEGGALAVENAMKVAFDWKAKKNGWDNKKANQLEIMHFCNAFHGRSGYTLSVTNTDPNKTDLFPKFKWTRIDTPTMRFPQTIENRNTVIELERVFVKQMETAFKINGDCIAAILIEPIQGEGGDNHFRPEFFTELRRLADKYDALLIYDEVQTGLGMTGKWWAYQHHNVTPDILVFGKKMQLGGIMVSNRIDDVENHCFKKASRINSTWGGGLVDMVRATTILETIVNENLLENANKQGNLLLEGLNELRAQFPFISNVRGQGLMCALDVASPALRNKIIENCFYADMIILPCGQNSIRFRPALTVSEKCIMEGLKRLRQALAMVDVS